MNLSEKAEIDMFSFISHKGTGAEESNAEM